MCVYEQLRSSLSLFPSYRTSVHMHSSSIQSFQPYFNASIHIPSSLSLPLPSIWMLFTPVIFFISKLPLPSHLPSFPFSFSSFLLRFANTKTVSSASDLQLEYPPVGFPLPQARRCAPRKHRTIAEQTYRPTDRLTAMQKQHPSIASNTFTQNEQIQDFWE